MAASVICSYVSSLLVPFPFVHVISLILQYLKMSYGYLFKDKLIFISKANNKCTNIVISPGKKEIKRRLKTISVNS